MKQNAQRAAVIWVLYGRSLGMESMMPVITFSMLTNCKQNNIVITQATTDGGGHGPAIVRGREGGGGGGVIPPGRGKEESLGKEY